MPSKGASSISLARSQVHCSQTLRFGLEISHSRKSKIIDHVTPSQPVFPDASSADILPLVLQVTPLSLVSTQRHNEGEDEEPETAMLTRAILDLIQPRITISKTPSTQPCLNIS
ncbi:hypothetical protein SUGI_1007950 [Cryptomeria japonica]|nr:hypothetical protein SUGI_1007950 [Cryptomeria japonica]